MIGLGDRKRVALDQKLAALDAEFNQWLKVTGPGEAYEKHRAQVLALTGHLGGLWEQTQLIFGEAKRAGTVLTDAGNLESLILGLRRIWEFFRSKLVQRSDANMRPFLEFADELAWTCYKPILDLYSSSQRQPPLVFLNGGQSPYALNREQAFRAEEVPGESLSLGTYGDILQRLPIPVIGVPWYQVAHIPDLPVVAHETGHTVEHDFGLHSSVLENIGAALQATDGKKRVDHWIAWSKEVFADLWGCLLLGPAFVSSLIDFLAADPSLIQNEVATTHNKYPTAHLRIRMCLAALAEMKFTAEAKTLGENWSSVYKVQAMPGFEDDVAHIAHAILGSKLAALSEPFLDMKELRFKLEDWEYAQLGAKERDEKNRDPASANTVQRLVASARILYDQDPDQYVQMKRGEQLTAFAKTLVVPGTRFREKKLSEPEEKDLSASSHQSGKQLFDVFGDWLNIPVEFRRSLGCGYRKLRPS